LNDALLETISDAEKYFNKQILCCIHKVSFYIVELFFRARKVFFML